LVQLRSLLKEKYHYWRLRTPSLIWYSETKRLAAESLMFLIASQVTQMPLNLLALFVRNLDVLPIKSLLARYLIAQFFNRDLRRS
jgi:hypothetical protein